MRIVLDTNVVLSALLWRGTAHQLLQLIHQQSSIQLISSPELLEELNEVLRRPLAAKRLALIGKTASDVLADYIEAVQLVEPSSVPRVVPNDVDDDQLIAVAVTAGADLIISGDKRDVLPLGSVAGIAIVNAREAIDKLAASASSPD